MEETRLGPYASLETYAVMQVGPPDFPAPYIIGNVDGSGDPWPGRRWDGLSRLRRDG